MLKEFKLVKIYIFIFFFNKYLLRKMLSYQKNLLLQNQVRNQTQKKFKKVDYSLCKDRIIQSNKKNQLVLKKIFQMPNQKSPNITFHNNNTNNYINCSYFTEKRNSSFIKVQNDQFQKNLTYIRGNQSELTNIKQGLLNL